MEDWNPIDFRDADVACANLIREPEIFEQLVRQLHSIECDFDVDVSEPYLLSGFHLDGGEALSRSQVDFRGLFTMA